MEELSIGDQTIRYDRELTRQVYSEIKAGGAEQCGCSYCRNFALQRAKAYPESAIKLLETLGIDFSKEDEVYELDAENGNVHYGGWLYFVGELVVSGEYLTSYGADFQFQFKDAQRLPISREAFGERVLAVDFTTVIPWIVEGEP